MKISLSDKDFPNSAVFRNGMVALAVLILLILGTACFLALAIYVLKMFRIVA